MLESTDYLEKNYLPKSFSLEVEPWRGEHKPILLPMLLDYLKSDSEHGSEIIPSWENAEILWDLGIMAANAGFPTLVGLYSSAEILSDMGMGSVAGFIIMIPLVTPFQLQYKTLQDIAAYVKPEFRGMGFSSQLRIEARKRAEIMGVGRILGIMYGMNLIDAVPEGPMKSSGLSGGFEAYGICGKVKVRD